MSPECMIFRCEDSVDGIFTAIYRAWEYGTTRSRIELNECTDMSLFAQYTEVTADYGIAVRVADTILKKLGDDIYSTVWQAALSDGTDKAQHIYRFLQKGFRSGCSIIDYRQDEDVSAVCAMAQRSGREAHKYTGFVRFEENRNGLLVSRINPKNNVIPLIAGHFADRLEQENWIIADTVHRCAAVHKAHCTPDIVTGISVESIENLRSESQEEAEFKKLWKSFFESVSIEERKNVRQQMTMMPLRYRTYMSAEQP